jgi:hypothetical protein
MMRLVHTGIATAFLGCASAAQATTVIIYVEPMTLQRYTKVIDTPGRDRALLCMAPPATSGCTEVPIKRTGHATASSSPSNSLRPSVAPWADSITRSG